jgi:hypothetical protein
MFQHIGRWAWPFRLLLHPMAEVSTCSAALRSNGVCPKQTVAPPMGPIPPSTSKNMSNSHGSQMPRWKKSVQNRIGWASGVVVLVPVDGLFPGPRPGGRGGQGGRGGRGGQRGDEDATSQTQVGWRKAMGHLVLGCGIHEAGQRGKAS